MNKSIYFYPVKKKKNVEIKHLFSSWIQSLLVITFIYILLPVSSFSQLTYKSTIDIDGKSLYVGNDIVARKYLNDILGVWDDNCGTRIKIYLINNPEYNPNGNSAEEKSQLHIKTEIECYNQPYYGKKNPYYEALREEAVVSVKRIGDLNWPIAHDESTLCYFEEFTYEYKITNFEVILDSDPDNDGFFDDNYKHVDCWYVGMDISEKSNPIFTIKGKTDAYLLDILNGYLSLTYYPTSPVPLKRISKEELNSLEQKKYAIKVTPLTSDIKPDGKSTVQISAQLYSYIPNDNSSSKPVAGKPLSFEINDLDRIKPGTLSSNSATTDANGFVTFTYTAPTAETLEQMELMNRLGTTIKISNEELKVEDLAYISFVTDKGKMWVEPGMSPLSDTGFVPPDKRYPALISANFYEGNLEPIRNTDVTFSIRENNSVGMLRSSDGREGKQITLKTDASGAASVLYYYAASTLPNKLITETIEAKTKNMAIPFKAYVSTGLNIVLENAKSGYEGSSEINAGEKIPLKITVKDEWNPNLDLSQIMNYWGSGNEAGTNRLYVKLEIQKQGFMPAYLLDFLGSENYPEPHYEELIYPRSNDEIKNLMYISEYSQNKSGFPTVMPLFSGTNNYEVRVSLVDEKGKLIFESQHPRQTGFVSIPTGLPADSYMIWFASNPLGPHTELSKFARLVLSTVTFGDFGGLGSVLSLADAAFAINSGDAEALANVMLSEIKGKIIGDNKDKAGLTGELFAEYNKMSIAEQYTSYAVNFETDKGMIAQMESKVLSGIASAGFGNDTKMVVLKGDGNQKLLIEEGQKPESKTSKALKDNFKIKISGLDKNTKDFFKKAGEKIKEKIKEKGEEIPVEEGKYVRNEKFNTISLKNGNVSVYVIPAEMNVVSENVSETIIN